MSHGHHSFEEDSMEPFGGHFASPLKQDLLVLYMTSNMELFM